MDVIEIQDNERESELIKLFNLTKCNYNRIGIDAKLHINNSVFNFEIKSTSTGKVSTASPLSLDHIEKWRPQHWLIGIYNKRAKLQYCVYGSPLNMKPWLDFWSNDIKRGLMLSDMIVDRIDKEMLYAVFGKKKVYSYDDAKFVYKNLYTTTQYKELMDHPSGYSINTMFNMFKEHNKTYLYRGSYINNPKIPKKYYSSWIHIYDNFDINLRKILLNQTKIPL